MGPGGPAKGHLRRLSGRGRAEGVSRVLDDYSNNFTRSPEPVRDKPPPWPAGYEAPDCGGEEVRSYWCEWCHHMIQVPVSCGDRACPSCRRRSYLRLQSVYQPLLAEVPTDLMALVTLTMRIDGRARDLAGQIERIRSAWRKLIRQRGWQSAVRGGLYSIEVQWSSRYRGAWNVHIHSLVEARRLLVRFWVWKTGKDGKRYRKECAEIVGSRRLTPQGLSAAWRGVTGDSYVVDITPVQAEQGGARGAMGYILKYLTKGGRQYPSRDMYLEYRRIMHGVRTVQTFGAWYATSKDYRFSVRPGRKPRPCKECGGIYWMSEWQYRAYERQAQPVPPMRAPPARARLVVNNQQTLQDLLQGLS